MLGFPLRQNQQNDIMWRINDAVHYRTAMFLSIWGFLAFTLSPGKADSVDLQPGSAANRKLPAFTAPNFRAEIPDAPSIKDLCELHLFSEPLFPMGAPPSSEENRALAGALRAHLQRGETDDFSALEEFVTKHAASPWIGSLELNLAMEYHRTGWRAKAVTMLEKAWAATKLTRDPAGKALADRAAAQLAVFYAQDGRVEPLSELLDAVKDRGVSGSSAPLLLAARDALWIWKNRPEAATACGMDALDAIFRFEYPGQARPFKRTTVAPSERGISLTQLQTQSQPMGDLQMAYRAPGAPMVLPAVMHWKDGHYTALLRELNGKYQSADAARYRRSVWLSAKAIDQESSGYFLVPAGKLPAGWRPATAAEGDSIWGGNEVSMVNPNATTPADKKPCECPPPLPCHGGAGMAVANVQLMTVCVNLLDSPVGYNPPIGPGVRFIVNYNQYEAGQPAVFTYANLGPLWTFNWMAFITDTPSSPAADVSYYTDGGGTLTFTGFDTNTQQFAPEVMTQSILTRTSTNSYNLTFPDGTQYIFETPTPGGTGTRQVFLTRTVDPQGNTIKTAYDSNYRVVAVTDAIGQVTTISYTDADPLKITKVTDPFGRFATFQYDTNGFLAQITDCIGLSSQFSYDASGAITSLATPYGTTFFSYDNFPTGAGPDRWLVITYPDGAKERYEFSDSANVAVPPSTPPATIPAGMNCENADLDDRNTYYWDRNAYPAYAANTNNYTSAKIFHWLHDSDDYSAASGVLESQKSTLENRVWYNYPDQPSAIETGSSSNPTAIGRVLDDGTTQIYQLAYNAAGNPSQLTDPIGRSISLDYASNQIDVVGAYETTGSDSNLLMRALFDNKHNLLAAWDASGNMTTNTYNSFGELLTSTDPLGHTTTFAYDANGYLLSDTGPEGGTNSTTYYGWDSAGRLAQITRDDGYITRYTYDNFDRVTNISYPDGTHRVFTFDKLDEVMAQDRLGRQTHYTYDSMRRLTSILDPMQHLLQFQYCGCGALATLVDALGRQTSWQHDLEGRVTERQNADGTSIQYVYENTRERLHAMFDEQGQGKIYTYNLDDTLAGVQYANAANFTPDVAFAYDPTVNRLVSMTDGIGTTSFSYYPVGVSGALQVSSATGPWANQAAVYQYDAIGRLTNRTLNGRSEAFAYDPLGRLTNFLNPLGNFGIQYDGGTIRLTNVTYPNGQATHYSYAGAADDFQLQQILNLKPDGSVLSAFGYGIDQSAEVTNWTQQFGGVTQNWALSYDADSELTGVVQSGSATASYGYGYDASGNQISESSSGASNQFAYDALNQMVFSSSNFPVANYQWDVGQRLVSVSQGASQTQFYYDGSGRRQRIVESSNGVVTADRRFIWSGNAICQEMDSNNVVINEYYPMGERREGTNYFYTRDHIGSVREMTDQSGGVHAEYSYDPYGVSTKLAGDLDSVSGFTGYFRHVPTQLSLAYARAYDPALGRWLSRDPLAEYGGVNLYAYVANNPASAIDPMGLDLGPLTTLVSDHYNQPQDVLPMKPPIAITDEEFLQEVNKMQSQLDLYNQNQNYYQIGLAWDSKWHSGNLQRNKINGEQDFCWRGRVIKGYELNYYFLGMLTAEENHYATEGETISFGWKAFFYRQLPSQNTIDAYNAGYNENQYQLPNVSPQVFYPRGAPVPTPGPGEDGGL